MVHQPETSFSTPHVNSTLALRFHRQSGGEATLLQIVQQTPPQRVVRSFSQADGSALVHLHNVSGGVLGGDTLALNVAVEVDARAQLTTPGATRIYCHRPGLPDARQQTTVRVERGGILEYLPDALIPFRQARYCQSTYIQLATDAGLFWWETIAPGRAAHGEHFGYDNLEMVFEIYTGDRPIALERYRLCPQEAPLSSLVRLGSYLYHTTFYICRVGFAEAIWLALEEELTAIAQGYTQAESSLWGVSTLPSDGVVIRGFSTSHKALPKQLIHFWQAAKQRLYALDIIAPRKTY